MSNQFHTSGTSPTTKQLLNNYKPLWFWRVPTHKKNSPKYFRYLDLDHSTVHPIWKWVFHFPRHSDSGDREHRRHNDRGHHCSKLLKSFRITAVRRGGRRHHHLRQSHHHRHHHDRQRSPTCNVATWSFELVVKWSNEQHRYLKTISQVEEMSRAGKDQRRGRRRF